MKVKEMRNLIKSTWLNGELLYAADSWIVTNSSRVIEKSYGYKCDHEFTETHMRLTDVDYYSLFWDEEEDCGDEHGFILAVKFDDHYKLFDSFIFGWDWFLKMISKSYIESPTYEFEIAHPNLSAVRWMGAFGRIRYSLKDSIIHELSSNRERAADVYVNSSFTSYEGEFFNVDFLEQIELKCSKENNDYLYDRCKLGFLYSPMSIRKAFYRDCYSIEIGKFLIDNPNYDNYESSSLFDYLVSEDKEEYDSHSEGFLKVGSKPYGILIRKPNTWHKDNLELVKEVAKKNNLLLYIVEW
jgi:hypothetical protein|nr:MAG TPA: hypothetical protein [Caudoviricetes sp.]